MGGGGHQISLPSLREHTFKEAEKQTLCSGWRQKRSVPFQRMQKRKSGNSGGGRKRHRELWRKQQRESFSESMTTGTFAAGRQGKRQVQTGVEKVGTKNPTYITNIPSTSSSALESSNGWTVIEFPARLSSCISSEKHHHQSLSVSSRTHH